MLAYSTANSSEEPYYSTVSVTVVKSCKKKGECHFRIILTFLT